MIESQQIKKDETLPKSHLETRSKPEEGNTGVKTGIADIQSAENIIKSDACDSFHEYG